jgi:GntR family transcriptional regulator
VVTPGRNVAVLGHITQDLPIPLYHQIKRDLRERIQAGDFREGSLLPTEAELQRHYGVSRTTVRQALSELVAEGLITRRAGKGTVVGRKIADMRPRRLVGFIEQLRARGVDVRSDVREIAVVPASVRTARELGVEPGTPVTRIVHRGLTPDGPIGMSRVHLACTHPVSAEEITRRGALLTFLRAHADEVHGRRFTHAVRTMSATLADPYEAQWLEVPPASALVVVTLRIFSGETAEVYLEARYRADRYEYREVLEV